MKPEILRLYRFVHGDLNSLTYSSEVGRLLFFSSPSLPSVRGVIEKVEVLGSVYDLMDLYEGAVAEMYDELYERADSLDEWAEASVEDARVVSNVTEYPLRYGVDRDGNFYICYDRSDCLKPFSGMERDEIVRTVSSEVYDDLANTGTLAVELRGGKNFVLHFRPSPERLRSLVLRLYDREMGKYAFELLKDKLEEWGYTCFYEDEYVYCSGPIHITEEGEEYYFEIKLKRPKNEP